VSERKNTKDNQTEQLQASLDSVTEELEAFAFSVSHDLHAPVRHIHSFAKLIEDRSADALDEKSRLYLQNILTSADRMSQLIEGLVAYSRVARSDVREINFRLNDLIREIISEDLTLKTRDRKIDWDIGDLGEIKSDPVLLRQVFTNLISNSLKFTKPVAEPRIILGRTDHPGRITIFVRDNGVGFDNKFAARAFDVFYRLHPQNQFEGSGIGLAIVKRIMTRCGGEARAEGKVNEGATISLEFPGREKEDQ